MHVSSLNCMPLFLIQKDDTKLKSYCKTKYDFLIFVLLRILEMNANEHINFDFFFLQGVYPCGTKLRSFGCCAGPPPV